MSTFNLLHNKIVLITGCNRGIGKAIAKTFVLNGAKVYANARTKDSLNNLISEIPQELKQNLIPVYFDITETDEVKKTIIRILKEEKRLDCLVNNAGVMKDALIGMITKQSMNELFDVNVFALLDILQYSVKIMSKQNFGSIINIASIVGLNGNSGQTTYSASKGAVIAITKSAAKELASKNIRVNAISPGVIDTDLLKDVNQASMDIIKSKIGMGRIGTPDDIANTAVFLASDLSEYLTGQIISVDGSVIL